MSNQRRDATGDRRKTERRKIARASAAEKRSSVRRVFSRRANLLGFPNFSFTGLSRPAIAWFCPYTPREIFHAAGMFSFRMMPNPASIGQSYNRMHCNLCPYVLNSLDVAIANGRHFDGAVIAGSCDAMRRMYDAFRAWVDVPFVYFLDVPRVADDLRKKYFTDELYGLARAIDSHFKIKITEDALKRTIEACNVTRKLLSELSALRKMDAPPVSGSEVINTVKRSMDTPVEEFNGKLSSLLETLQSNSNSGDTHLDSTELRCVSPELSPRPDPNMPRIAMIGGYFDQEFITEVIENYGATLVYEQMSVGSAYFNTLVDQNSDPFEALSERYLEKTPSARMVCTDKGYEQLISAIKEYRVNGVIFYSLKFCDQNLIYYADIKKKLSADGVPVLFLESDRTSDNLGQIKTRIQTFLDML